MTSKYLTWSPEKIRREILTYEKGIKDYTSLLTANDTTLRDYATFRIKVWRERIKELEGLLKPKVDYEDGTWV